MVRGVVADFRTGERIAGATVVALDARAYRQSLRLPEHREEARTSSAADGSCEIIVDPDATVMLEVLSEPCRLLGNRIGIDQLLRRIEGSTIRADIPVLKEESQQDPVDLQESASLSDKDVTALEERAEAGDADAIYRLHEHYLLDEQDSQRAELWLRKGVDVEDFRLLVARAIELSTPFGDCVEAKTLLERARRVAKQPRQSAELLGAEHIFREGCAAVR